LYDLQADKLANEGHFLTLLRRGSGIIIMQNR